MAYTPDTPSRAATSDELRARIPGWGADLNPHDRPAVPRLQPQPDLTGSHWEFPEQQPEIQPRERSIEHRMLTPVFGTAVATKGLSGVIRRYSYRRFSEARAAHWLLLVAADRVDSVESSVGSLLTRHPDNPVAETGVRGEFSHHGLSSRKGKRVDVRHQVLDPVIVAVPWFARGAAVYFAARAVVRIVKRVA